MKLNISLAAVWTEIALVLLKEEWDFSQVLVNLSLIVSYVMFPAVETVPFARLQISGGNGTAFPFHLFPLLILFLFYLSFKTVKFIFFLYRNSGMGNGIHCLQVQIAMRGTFDGKALTETVCYCIPLLVRIVRLFLDNLNFFLFESKIGTNWLCVLSIISWLVMKLKH